VTGRLPLLAATAAISASGTALGARPTGLEQAQSSTHFVAHYTLAGEHAAPSSEAVEAMLGTFEAALAHHTTELEFPPPLDDGDGRTDVFVLDLASVKALGAAISDNSPALQASGYLYMDDGSITSAETVAHELFHLIQIGQWQPMDRYVLEATAEWAGFRFVDFGLTVDAGLEEPVALGETLGAPDMSLTCSGGSACGFSGYEAGGYSRWHFYEYVTERFGGQPVKEIFAKAKALNEPGLTSGDILTAYFADKGTTLGNVFGDWTVANMNGNYTAAGLKGVQPVAFSTTLTGSESGALAAQRVPVNHLAARYVAFKRGSGSSGPCYAATLNVTVTLPAAAASRPYFLWTMPGSTPVPFAIDGSTARVSVPWDTCVWQYNGLVSLPNTSTTVDAATFTVNATITVDKSRIATSTPPPAPTYNGPTVPAPTGDEAPSIALYGPETLRVSRKKRVLRLVVFSSGDGKLDAQLGALGLGTRVLRAGNNELRFTLPKTALRSLAATNTLMVTPVSSGGSRGASVSRKLVLTK
jgi:hypothetical protein